MSLLLLLHGGGPQAAPVTDPEDLDSDVTYTAYVTKADAATIRPPRLWLRHAANSLRNADLLNAERLSVDRYFTVGCRKGRGNTLGLGHRFVLEGGGRAGHCAAIAFVEIEYEPSDPSTRIPVADSTSRTSKVDGATLAVPTFHVKHAADSLLNSALTATGTDQDRFETRHHVASAIRIGIGHRFTIESDGRAGNCGAPMFLEIDYKIVGETQGRVVAERR